MALHYIEDLAPVFRMIQRALRPGGWSVFTVAHPVITSHDAGGDGPRTAWLVDHYFDRGPRTRPWFGSMVTWHHRTIEDYLDLLLSSGFTIDRLCECEPEAALLAGDPDELQRRRHVPLILLLAASAPEIGARAWVGYVAVVSELRPVRSSSPAPVRGSR